MFPRVLPLTLLAALLSAAFCLAELPDLDAYWDYSDPAATEMRFRELLEDSKWSGETDFHFEIRSQIARTLGLRQSFDEAHALLDSLETQLSTSSPKAAMRYHLERGRTLNSSGKPDESKIHFLEAYKIGVGIGEDPLSVDAAHMMGIVEQGAASLEWNERAIALAKESKDPKANRWQGSLLNNTGWTYHDLGEYEKALAMFSDALVFREQQGNPVSIRIANCCIARCYRSLGWYQEALAAQRTLLTELEEQNESDGYVFEEIGECLLAVCHTAEARPYLQKAYDLLSQDAWMSTNEGERLARLKRIAEGAKE